MNLRIVVLFVFFDILSHQWSDPDDPRNGTSYVAHSTAKCTEFPSFGRTIWTERVAIGVGDNNSFDAGEGEGDSTDCGGRTGEEGCGCE